MGEAIPQVEVHTDGDCLALGVAALFVDMARGAVKARGRFTVALAGGSTPRRAYEILSKAPFADFVPWEHVHVFWGDERCVDPHDPRSNELMAREALLKHVPIPAEQVHPMRCVGGEAAGRRFGTPFTETTARQVADEYEGLLRAVLHDSQAAGLASGCGGERGGASGLDLVLLGLGPDGHTASLFPGSEVLGEERRWAVAAVASSGKSTNGGVGGSENLWRVTLTAQFINKAATVVFMIGGRAKAAAVKEVLEGPFDPLRLPAQLIRPASGDLRWHLDDDSASLLARARTSTARRGCGG